MLLVDGADVSAIVKYCPPKKLLLGETVNVFEPVPIKTLLLLVSVVAFNVIAAAAALISSVAGIKSAAHASALASKSGSPIDGNGSSVRIGMLKLFYS